MFSRGRLLRGIFSAAVAVFPLISLTGCADVITYANKSRDRGIELYNEGAYGDAAGAFRNAVKQDPRQYHSHYYLALCYDQMGQHHMAFSQYRTAMDVMSRSLAGKTDHETRPKIINSYADSIVRHDGGDVELTALTQSAEANRRAQEWVVLAKVYRIRGDADMAIDSYRRAAHWDDARDLMVRKEFGLYLLELSQAKDAEYYLRQAYHINPGDEQVVAGLRRIGLVPVKEKGQKVVLMRAGSAPTAGVMQD
jgi:Tfp pilus assembly protein PilF